MFSMAGRNPRRSFAAFAAFALLAATAPAATVTDHYTFKASLLVPRTYSNTQSRGYRSYQRQHLAGEMTISYDTTEKERPVIAVTALTNLTHRISGKPITYDCTVDEYQVTPRANLVGNNRTNTFKIPSLVFFMDAEPSYALESGEDNSLLVTLAGNGSSSTRGGVQYIRYIRGNAAGTLGCGCKAYGHVSPTRVAGWNGATDIVDDVAAVYGSWTARWKSRKEED